MRLRIVASFLLVVCFTVLSACEETQTHQPNVEDISQALQTSIEFPEMAKVDAERLAFFYNIPLESVESFSVAIAGSGGYADEIAIFRLKDKRSMRDIQAAVEKRVEWQTKAFDDYRPSELQKLKNGVVLARDNYLCFVISSDNKKAEAVLEEYF